MLQSLIRVKLGLKRVKYMKLEEGLMRVDKVFCNYKQRLTFVRVYNIGLLRSKAILRI